jgi:hypothetical protein
MFVPTSHVPSGVATWCQLKKRSPPTAVENDVTLIEPHAAAIETLVGALAVDAAAAEGAARASGTVVASGLGVVCGLIIGGAVGRDVPPTADAVGIGMTLPAGEQAPTNANASTPNSVLSRADLEGASGELPIRGQQVIG